MFRLARASRPRVGGRRALIMGMPGRQASEQCTITGREECRQPSTDFVEALNLDFGGGYCHASEPRSEKQLTLLPVLITMFS